MTTSASSPARRASGNAGRVGRFLATRLGLALITLWLLSVLVFAGGQLLPGDIGRAILGPLAAKYSSCISLFVRGDLVLSYGCREPVAPFIGAALANSAKLGLLAFIV